MIFLQSPTSGGGGFQLIFLIAIIIFFIQRKKRNNSRNVNSINNQTKEKSNGYFRMCPFVILGCALSVFI
jgi:hypothetical protein